IARLALLPRNMRVAPVIEAQGLFEGAAVVPVYGIDPLSEGNLMAAAKSGLAISSPLARRLGIRSAGGKIAVQINDSRQAYDVAGILESKDAEFALMDIADAQSALRSYGRLDRIDIYASPREDFGRLEAEIRALLPASYSLDKPGARAEENQRML